MTRLNPKPAWHLKLIRIGMVMFAVRLGVLTLVNGLGAFLGL
jgi:hypothetical protein